MRRVNFHMRSKTNIAITDKTDNEISDFIEKSFDDCLFNGALRIPEKDVILFINMADVEYITLEDIKDEQ